MIADTIDPKELREQYKKVKEFCTLYEIKDPFLEFYDSYFSEFLNEVDNLLNIVDEINETGKVLSEKLPDDSIAIEKPLIERVYSTHNNVLFKALISQSEILLEESKTKLQEYDKVLRQVFKV